MRVRTIPPCLWVVLLAGSAVLAAPALGQYRAGEAPIDRSPALRLEYRRAERAWRAGSSLAEAKVRLDRVLDRLPGDHEARRLRARVLLDMRRWSEALSDGTRLASDDPGDGVAWLLLSEALLRTGQVDAARTALLRAADLLTDGADDHIRLSRIAQELDLLAQSEAFARVALAIGPDRPAAFRRLALVFMAQGRPDDAVILLANGIDEGIVPPPMIARDSVLSTLRTHSGLAGRL